MYSAYLVHICTDEEHNDDDDDDEKDSDRKM